MKRKYNFDTIVVSIMFILFIMIASMDIGRPPIDLHQYRQTQTLSTIHNYYENGINLFKPEINNNGSNSLVILEFPLYQAISAFLMKIIGFHVEISRILNIVFTIITAWSLGKISEDYIKSNTFGLVMLFYLFNPSTIFWSAIPIIDSLALTSSVLSVFFMLIYIKKNNSYAFLFAIALGAIAVSVKITSAFIPFFSMALILALEAWIRRKLDKGVLIKFLIFYISIAVAFFAWALYAKSVNDLNPHPYTTSGLSWYLGSMDQRISFQVWGHFYNRLISNHFAIFCFLSLIVCFAYGALYKNARLLFVSLILIFCAILYLFIFINLNFIHTYYQIPINIVLALVASAGFSLAIDFLGRWGYKINQIFLLYSAIALTYLSNHALASGWVDLSPIRSPYTISSCEYDIGNQIDSYFAQLGVQPKMVGIVLDYSDDCWNGSHSILYHMKKKGYVVRSINDSALEKESLDFIINVYRDRNKQSKSDWMSLVDNNLQGGVSEWRFAILQNQEVKVPSSYFMSDEFEVVGTNENRFNASRLYHDLKIPPFSMVDISFSTSSHDLAGENYGYLLLRTYSGGYEYDQFRIFNVSGSGESKHQFLLKTDRLNDYVLEFGKINDGSYTVLSPIKIDFFSRLK